jgi:hypothetical protein
MECMLTHAALEPATVVWEGSVTAVAWSGGRDGGCRDAEPCRLGCQVAPTAGGLRM